MNISSNILDQHRGHQSRIKTYLKQAIQHTDAEFEFIYGEYENTNKIDKIIFLRLLNNLKQKYECDELNLLDIRTQEISHEGQKLSNIRCTIQGISDIKKYCTHLVRHKLVQDVFLASMLNRLIELEANAVLKELRERKPTNPIAQFFRTR